ncbi:light-independent protochlorophyllide reductase iron-sulfur ATP-binding protein [Vulcanimicrobium alpinum]|uniref:nitrogenase n=2 Tax=Vulcanimicrobium alpinum TaxID=3016050 RepID=A0AAN2CAF6_UNVUL|nr:ferredoxin:protochlorophyllide reductase (ATP-dependent) iron-sulfur ATP-binding protein [Vulcanimicrobium alpinum]BDE07304.1 light-independent protochlorophyllide reductase iron-sulfur ATP-binding protein [Vulcanimicrobium alpinum]
MDMLKIAVYGKGGIGKSTFSSNLSAAFGRAGKKTIQVGCDPKHDSTFTLTGDLIPTVVEVLSAAKFKSDEIERDEIIFPGKYGVDCVEAGGPPAGAGCGGYVVGETVKLLEKFGVYNDYDVMVFDVLGDVVCGGFSAPLQHSEQVIIVATNDFDSIFAANRIATAIGIKQRSGGGTLAGIVANRASNAELVGPYAQRIGSVCLTCIPENDSVRKSRLTAQTVFEQDPSGELGRPWTALAARLLDGVPLVVPTPIPERELFKQLGADYVRPADIPAPAMAV